MKKKKRKSKPPVIKISEEDQTYTLTIQLHDINKAPIGKPVKVNLSREQFGLTKKQWGNI